MASTKHLFPLLIKTAFLLVMTCALVFSCKKDNTPVPLNKGKLQDVRFWAYQLDGLEEPAAIDAICNSHYDLIVMDQQRSILGAEDYDTKSDVARMHGSTNSKGKAKVVLCYFDVGQAESYRAYWQSSWTPGSPTWILSPDPDGWNDSYGVKYWSPAWKNIMKECLGKIIDDGFDGVYLDWLEIYNEPAVIAAAATEGKNPENELVSFLTELATYARSRDSSFIFIAQNAAEMGANQDYIKLFDAIAHEDIWYDGSGDPDNGGSQGDVAVDPLDTQEYLDQLKVWQLAGKPVFDVEYAEQPAHVSRAYSLGKENGFINYVTLRLLDKLSTTPPPGY
ncbi:MAG: endo alpha-1,4 polygalactosaminidase [Bacteroidetes bacterium]|nr:endo alpha-1,4 polygalactosaminidase [Bacteroidota bacterium]